jgi:hypothetical protein
MFKTYAGPWSRFREWCASKNVPHLPAAPVVVALYMMKLLRTAASPAPILSFSGAVFLHHTMAGYASPIEHHLVCMARKTAKRVRPAGQNKKHPFLASHLCRIISTWGGKSANLHELMMATTIVLGFTTFFRYDSLRLIDWDTIRFVGQSHMEVFVEKSNTDQYRVGTWSLVARVGSDFCPVALVERLLVAGQYARLERSGRLIRSVVISPSAQYIKASQPSYTTVFSWFKQAAVLCDLDPQSYGTHFGRRGGTTGAAANEVPDRLFKQHGGWASERCKDGYVVSCLQDRLSVTRTLGL